MSDLPSASAPIVQPSAAQVDGLPQTPVGPVQRAFALDELGVFGRHQPTSFTGSAVAAIDAPAAGSLAAGVASTQVGGEAAPPGGPAPFAFSPASDDRVADPSAVAPSQSVGGTHGATVVVAGPSVAKPASVESIGEEASGDPAAPRPASDRRASKGLAAATDVSLIVFETEHGLQVTAAAGALGADGRERLRRAVGELAGEFGERVSSLTLNGARLSDGPPGAEDGHHPG